jgi:beta-N-acetylhexosaminidase
MKNTDDRMNNMFPKGLYITALLVLLFFSARSQSKDSLDMKIGQMILIGFPKAEVDPDVLREVKEGKVGSIILFEKNIPPKNSFVALKKIIWTYQQAAPVPLLVSIDQEGGKVNRLKDKYGFPRSITADAMGNANSLDSVRFYGEATASTLAGLGFNVNFAPVVDLAANPTNPVIVMKGRAFSNNEDSVALLAKEFIKQHRKYGVITSLKHFPGHGSSKDDTHLGIADVTNTWTDRELKPYKTLIDSGYADAIMTSHIVNKSLDKKGHPGTLSADILTGILRNRLHFDGVIFTDDMQMHAITKHYGLEEAIKLAINGGVDIMTFSNNIAGSDERTVDKVHGIIKRMVQNGEIKKERIDESYRRIMKLKSRLNAGQQATLAIKELEQTNIELQAARQALQQKEAEAKELKEKLTQAQTPKEESSKKKKKSKRKKS